MLHPLARAQVSPTQSRRPLAPAFSCQRWRQRDSGPCPPGQATTPHSVSHTDTAISKTVASRDTQSRFCFPTACISGRKASVKRGCRQERELYALQGGARLSVVVRAESTTEPRLSILQASAGTRRHLGIKRRLQVFGSGKRRGNAEGRFGWEATTLFEQGHFGSSHGC